jgi:glycosyltransferase involved in cell wall biosynthesis
VRIAYVITRADAVGGASIHVRDLAQAMIERGHEAVVFLGGEGPVTGQLTAAGVPFRSLRLLRRAVHPVRDARAFGELLRALDDFRPDLVSAHTAKAGWIGRAACARLGLPVLYTPHGWSIGDRISAAHGLVFRLAERAAARWASGIVCVSQYERELALRAGIAGPEKLHVIHNGVRDIPAALRADPASSPVRIVSIARLEPPKDHRTLLEALALLRSLDWEMELIGGGPLEREARGLAGALGIAGRVHLSGYQPDPAAALARAQIFVLSSRSEGFPRSVLEAMRAGLPVVASDVGGVSEAVSEGINGLLVAPGQPEALAGALRELIAEPLERQRLGAAARRIYEERFGFERMLGETFEVYDTVVNSSRWARQTQSR